MNNPSLDHLLGPGRRRRIVVVGTTGSGKTTLARQLSARLGMPHVELDALNWEPNWTQAPPEVFRLRIAEALQGGQWVVDGNYHVGRDILWSQAQLVVWLDYPLTVILWRLLRRTIRRVITREELWNGNKERFWAQFFSRDSILLWALKTYRRRRREYHVLFILPEYAHLTVVRLHSPRATRAWLSSIAVPQATSPEHQDG